ncbi:MAG TPA: hypothetical protein VJJ83_00700 [Candidatus Babeliales bacterium]|nr:hypothetical protein [Candidatus Babeliales bacterium]
MFFFTNILALCQELKTKTVSHGAALAYQALMVLALIPWSLVAHLLRSLLAQPAAQSTLMAALLGSAAQYVGVILALLQFRYYIKQVNTQGQFLSFAALYWVVGVRYFLRTLAVILAVVAAGALALKFQLISKAVLGGLLFGLVLNPDFQLITHFVIPVIFAVTYQLLFHEALRELVRA